MKATNQEKGTSFKYLSPLLNINTLIYKEELSKRILHNIFYRYKMKHLFNTFNADIRYAPTVATNAPGRRRMVFDNSYMYLQCVLK